MKMKMKIPLMVTYFLIAQVILTFADQKTDSQTSGLKKQENGQIKQAHYHDDEKSQEVQRKRDPGYHYNKPSHSIREIHPESRYLGHRGRIITRLQSQINRPFKQYGLPNQESGGFSSDQSTTSVGLTNQEVPDSVRQNYFVPENPIASQNNQPFGQHTANYLPPRNQKLPVVTPAYQFSTYESPNNQQFQQQQLRFPEQNQQFQVENQNAFGQSFETQNIGQNEFQSQQISDAALFLTQNAQAISSLYGAPAPNQNYAPHNHESDQFQQSVGQHQHGQQDQNLHISAEGQSSSFPNQLPSYASGVFESGETLANAQSLEKDKIIFQLQQALSSRENSAQLAQNEKLAHTLPHFGSGEVSFNQHSTSYSPTATTSSSGFQGYYLTSPIPTTTTPAPIQAQSTPIATTTTTLQSLGSEASNSQLGANLQVTQTLGPTFVHSVHPQYGGFIPTAVASSGFVPSTPTFGTALYPTVAKPVENTPTHFSIPIPSLDISKPVYPSNTLPITIKPPNDQPNYSSFPSHPNTPTFSITLSPIHHQQASPPVHTPVIKPNPVSIIPATTPIHPTYGLHPAATPIYPTYGLHQSVVNPSFVYKPVKVYPVYYYPGLHHRKTASTTHPWNYAPSYTQAKIWK